MSIPGVVLALAAVQGSPMPVTMQQAVAAPATSAAADLLLPQDTPVELMAVAEVNTDKARPGDLIRFRVNRVIELGGRVVVPVGTPAYGTVVSASDSGGLGKSGRMTARLLNIQLGDLAIPLDGQMAAKGTGAGSAGVAVLFTGIAGLFHRGNNAKIKAGEIVAGFVADDTPLGSVGVVTPVAPVASPAVPVVPVSR